MKKFYYFLFLIFSFNAVNSQIVHIPDADFKAALLNANPANNTAYGQTGGAIVIDVNGDGEIQLSEALLVYKLQLTIFDIYDLTGIEAFTNLEYFDCSNNHIITLDLSNSPNLNYLHCANNNLTNLNLTGNQLLEHLSCSENNLSTIDLSNNPNLNYVLIGRNELTQIDLSSNPLLESFSCNINNLSELDVSSNPLLENLVCSYNEIIHLNISANPELLTLNCNNNNLSELNLSGVPNLSSLKCQYNNLTELDFSQNPNLSGVEGDANDLTSLNFSNNPVIGNLSIDYNPLTYINIKNGSNSLYLYEFEVPYNCYICVDEGDVAGYDLSTLPSGSTVSTYCSVVPGGIYNSILGSVLYDGNNNGSCESEIYELKINISDGTGNGHTFTNVSGEFEFYSVEGSYTITPEVENPELFNINPQSATLYFPILDGSTQTQNFCITPNGNHPDVEIIISPLNPARPGFEATYKVVYRNKGNQTVSGSINFEFNDDLLDFNSSNPIPANQSNGLLNYNFTELHPFESREIILSFEVNTPIETPPVNIDDVLTFTAQISPTDENPDDNTFELNQIVVGSYDPNDILCLEGTSVAPEMIGEELHYRIRFENTGNFPAERVVVAMGINPDEYDISSFQLLNTSHQVQARIVNNVAEFFFEEINLGPNEEGDILLSMKSLETLSVGDAVMSYADIYFDYNYPITTNEAETIFEILGLNEINSNVEISIYPNPVKDNFTIQSDSKINQIEFYDVAGRLLKVSLVNKLESIQNISNFSAGTYFVKIYTEKGITAQKIIKQ